MFMCRDRRGKGKQITGMGWIVDKAAKGGFLECAVLSAVGGGGGL